MKKVKENCYGNGFENKKEASAGDFFFANV